MKRLMVIFLLVISGLLAKDYALIIGISNYKTIGKLSHIESDIATYRKILKRRGVNRNRIKILRDTQATKANIKNYLKDVAQNIKKFKNNRFFMFFAGHGISIRHIEYNSQIEKSGLLKYLTNSGIILPYEYSYKDIANTIIIGKKDLRPFLKEIDKRIKESLIIFDACYSGNSIRGKQLSITPFIYSNSKDFPYKNIVYIASATSRSKAKSGVLSSILNSCISKQSNLRELRVCMNNQLMYVGQRAVVVSKQLR